MPTELFEQADQFSLLPVCQRRCGLIQIPGVGGIFPRDEFSALCGQRHIEDPSIGAVPSAFHQIPALQPIDGGGESDGVRTEQ